MNSIQEIKRRIQRVIDIEKGITQREIDEYNQKKYDQEAVFGLGGFYDRYLPKCTEADMIVVAFEAQKADHIPTDEFDFAVPAVATEERLIRQKNYSRQAQ